MVVTLGRKMENNKISCGNFWFTIATQLTLCTHFQFAALPTLPSFSISSLLANLLFTILLATIPVRLLALDGNVLTNILKSLRCGVSNGLPFVVYLCMYSSVAIPICWCFLVLGQIHSCLFNPVCVLWLLFYMCMSINAIMWVAELSDCLASFFIIYRLSFWRVINSFLCLQMALMSLWQADFRSKAS